MASTAAIVFVKNDVDDIGWWMAHHLAVGFDALIVIDDHSTDGTWDVIQNAASILPVEPQRTRPDDKSSYAERRSDAYGLAIESCRNRFDWVICLESDEYVSPESAPDMSSFLSRFDQADGIFLNWSIFGSNGHVTRPTESPTSAYTRRAPLEFADHRPGKTFIRPDCFTGQFIDGCHWAIASERFYRADGTLFDPEAPVNWQGARILHYLTRHLTHYTSRLARLPTPGQATPDLWSHFNRNEVEDLEPRRFLAATREYAARLGRVMLDTFYWRMRKDIQENSLSFMPDTSLSIRSHQSMTSPLPLRFASLVTSAGETLAYDPLSHRLTFLPAGDVTSEGQQVLLVMEHVEARQDDDLSQPNGFLLLPSAIDTAPTAPGAFLTHWVPVHSDACDDDAQAMALFLPASAQWLSRDETGAMALEPTASLRLTPQPVTPAQSILSRIRPFHALRSYGDTLHDFCLGLDLLRAPQADAIACAIAHLPTSKRGLLQTRYPGLIPPWLAQA